MFYCVIKLHSSIFSFSYLYSLHLDFPLSLPKILFLTDAERLEMSILSAFIDVIMFYKLI